MSHEALEVRKTQKRKQFAHFGTACSFALPIAMFHRLKIFVIAVVLAFGMVSEPTVVFALTFTPERIETEVYPGVPVTEELTLLNETGTTISIVLEPVELDLNRAESGQAIFLLDTADSPSVAWISVEPRQFVLEPAAIRNVRVMLSAPDASSGSLMAGIAATFRPVRSDEEGRIVLDAVTGPFVFARVLSDESEIEGSITTLNLAKGKRIVSRLPALVSVSFANTGSVHLKPLGTIDVRDIFGRTVDTLVINPDQSIVLPGTTRELGTRWGGVRQSRTKEPSSKLLAELQPFRLGPYTFAAEMTYGDDSVSQAQRTLIVFPWRSIVILLVSLTGIVVAKRRLRRV